MSDGERYYWCQTHHRVESGDDVCPERDRLGPYPTPDAARNWKSTHDAREDRWDAEDEAWEGS